MSIFVQLLNFNRKLNYNEQTVLSEQSQGVYATVWIEYSIKPTLVHYVTGFSVTKAAALTLIKGANLDDDCTNTTVITMHFAFGKSTTMGDQ